MDRTTLCRTSLIASAFVLSGLLLMAVHWRGGLAAAAQGEMIVSKDTFTVMTARTRQDEEAVFVLDSLEEKLLIYTLDLRGTGGRIKLLFRQDLRELFR